MGRPLDRPVCRDQEMLCSLVPKLRPLCMPSQTLAVFIRPVAKVRLEFAQRRPMQFEQSQWQYTARDRVRDECVLEAQKLLREDLNFHQEVCLLQVLQGRL